MTPGTPTPTLRILNDWDNPVSYRGKVVAEYGCWEVWYFPTVHAYAIRRELPGTDAYFWFVEGLQDILPGPNNRPLA